MPVRDGATVRLRRHGLTTMVLGLLVASLLAAGAYASSTVTVKRCGYVTATYGRSGLYPWHMSCSAAKAIVLGSEKRHIKTIAFGGGFDGAAVEIDGRFWVCTGQMGVYECGYPYRPKTVKGDPGYAGPFTESVQFPTCSLEPGCTRTTRFTQPSSSPSVQ